MTQSMELTLLVALYLSCLWFITWKKDREIDELESENRISWREGYAAGREDEKKGLPNKFELT